MIQIDINSPETGQAASQSLRTNRPDQKGEESPEFVQIWSEFIEPETQKVAPPNIEQAPQVEEPLVTATMAIPQHSPPATEGGGKKGQLERQLVTYQATVQSVARDPDNKVRLPIEGLENQTEQIAAVSAKPTVQVPVSTSTQAPIQATAQVQRVSNPITHPVPEPSRAHQPIAKPDPLAPSKSPSPAIPSLPTVEPNILMSNVAPELELTAPQPLHTNGTNTTATVTSAPQTTAPQITSQIVAAITQTSNTTTEVTLNPEELGRVRISLMNGEAGMTVNILTERAETADLMRRNIELLARELRDMGYENPSFTFGERSGGSPDAWDDKNPELASENRILCSHQKVLEDHERPSCFRLDRSIKVKAS